MIPMVVVPRRRAVGPPIPAWSDPSARHTPRDKPGSSAIQRFNDKRNGAVDVSEDAGFTLIELMVVLLILAILLAIAIPTFLGVTKSANDRAAQSNLNTALLNAKAQYQQNSQAYPASGTLVTALSSAEPSLTFQTAASANQNQISVFVTADFAALVMATYSAQTHNCWIVVDTPTATLPVALTPFVAATQTPTVGVDTTLAPVAATTAITFADNQLGPTYAEIKSTSAQQVATGDCQASVLSAHINTNYRYSYTAFPAI